MKRFCGALILSATMFAPASAQWAVFDAASFAKVAASLEKEIQLVQSAQSELKQLPAGLFSATNASSRLQVVQQLLQSAKAACSGVTNGRSTPSICNVQASVAQQQSATIGQDLATLDSLRNAAAGSSGNLQIQQTNAAALISIGQQLHEQKDRDLAAEQRRGYDTVLKTRMYSTGGSVHLGSTTP